MGEPTPINEEVSRGGTGTPQSTRDTSPVHATERESTGSSYTPKVGDVVEFEYEGDTCRGLVHGKNSDLEIISDREPDLPNNTLGVLRPCVKNMRQIGHIDIIGEDFVVAEVQAAFKAYFAEQEKPDVANCDFKVGELVEVTVDCHSVFAEGEIVKHLESTGSGDMAWCVNDDGKEHYIHYDRLRPLSGTYAERQKKWVDFYDIKKGGKVKVVRKFKKTDDSFCGGDWDYNGAKASMQGGIYCVRSLSTNCVYLSNSADNGYYNFPYFALEPVSS